MVGPSRTSVARLASARRQPAVGREGRHDAPVAVTDGRTKVRGPMWSTDGRFLYYVSNREGAMDVWRESMTGDGEFHGAPRDYDRPRGPAGRALRLIARSRIRKGGWSRTCGACPSWRIVRRRGLMRNSSRLIRRTSRYIDVSRDGQPLVVSSDRSGNHDLWMIPMAPRCSSSRPIRHQIGIPIVAG